MNREIQFLYNTPQENVKVEAMVKDDTLWLTQKAMSQLFGVDRSVITKHLSNIFNENELSREATSANFALVQVEGQRTVSRNIDFYNLEKYHAHKPPKKPKRNTRNLIKHKK